VREEGLRSVTGRERSRKGRASRRFSIAALRRAATGIPKLLRASVAKVMAEMNGGEGRVMMAVVGASGDDDA
jgi:hypothetical protein